MKPVYTNHSKIEQNRGVVFPGYSLELVREKQVKQINLKLNGRLCTPKDIVFVEVSDCHGNFTFKYSEDK